MKSKQHEPKVTPDSSMPKHYTFVRKGNIYITKHCRVQTHAAGQTVYIVENASKKRLGIRVPQHIYQTVRRANLETQDARAQAVHKKDLALEAKIRSEILRLYSKIPSESVEEILKQTLKKRSGRVGRNRELEMREVVDLAVRAHIRHILTGYDEMLRRGLDRETARQAVKDVIDEKAKDWGGKVRRFNGNKKGSGPKSAAKMNEKRIARPSMLPTKKKTMVRKVGAVKKMAAKSTPVLDPSARPLMGIGLLRRSSLRIRDAADRDFSEELDLMELD